MNQNKFQFIGRGPSSKSLLNRAWIVKSYYPHFKIIGSSLCDDVQIIKKAVFSLGKNEPVFCRESATAFRFMALRASRKKGTHVLSGDKKLFSRPHQPLIRILSQLGVKSHFERDQQFIINSNGWRPLGDAVTLSSEFSSQFASALFLNSFGLEKDLFIYIENLNISLSYLEMTLSFLKNLGFQIKGHFPEFQIPKQQKIKAKSYNVEPDMSCLFALSCFASLYGEAIFSPWCEDSLQPDHIFPTILEKMEVNIEKKNNTLKVSSPKFQNKPIPPCSHLKGILFNLNNNPDLFPSLAVLCSLSQGRSLLYGAPHLKYKESDRIKMTTQLIQKTGRKTQIKDDQLYIQEQLRTGTERKPSEKENEKSSFVKKELVEKSKIIFDPQSDHRMAMAGALLAYAGFNIKIKNPACVNKSFPEFWNIIKISPFK